MNKNLYIGILLTALLLTGCANLDSEDQYYEYKVPDKKLHTITPIEPNQFTAALKPVSTQSVTEPNLPTPPAEMKISIEECRALTLQNNLELQAQLISPAIAAASLKSAEAAFEPSLYARSFFYNSDEPGRGSKVEGGSYSPGFGASQSHNISSTTGVQLPLRTGGELNFNLADNRTHNLGSSPEFSTDFSFSVSQPLLKNAGNNNQNTYLIRLTRYDNQITDLTTKLEVIKVLATADRTYWRLYAARKELEVRKKQHELAMAQLERARRMVDAGQMAKVEIVRAEAGVARQLAAIITAENDLRSRQREFKQVINNRGLNIETSTIMIPSTETSPKQYIFNTEQLIEQAFENRSELLELELRIARDITEINYRNNQLLPLTTMEYTYNVPGRGPTRNDAYDMLNKKNFENHTLGITLSIPLGNEAAKNSLLQALYQKRQRLATKANQKQLVKQEVLNALDSTETNWQQIMASRQAAILEGQLYETEIRQFEVGLRTSTDVLDAQSKFADAQSAEITALVNYEISLIDLAYATGTLLGVDKILWEPITPVVPVN